jgi:hypothetical protein
VTKPRLVSGVVRGELTDGEVVLSLSGGERALILNEMGDVIAGLCDGSRSVADIAAVIRESMTVANDDDIARDVETLVEHLVRAGLAEAV